MTELTDDLLITRAQNGDSDAMAALYQRYVGVITRYISYRISDQAVIEDLTAEVFLRMVEGLPRYQITGAPFEAWLYRIAAARVATFYRTRERRPVEALHENLQSGQTAPEQALQNNEELAELREALQQLNDEQQTILILRFVERKSHEYVARVLDKSERAVATAQHRALKKLAQLLGVKKSVRHYIRGK
jgi:RNA polymerase sigma-70 factor (ECF subfamily)